MSFVDVWFEGIRFLPAFSTNSPYLTEYPTMIPFTLSGPLHLMLTLLSDVTLYVSLNTGPGTKEVGRNC